jgi:hypothetical protein
LHHHKDHHHEASRPKPGADDGEKPEKQTGSENKREREVDRLIREAEISGIGDDMPGLDYSMTKQGWSHGEAESFTKLMSAAGLSEESAESVAVAVLVSEENGMSHREAVAAGLEIYGALGGLSE